MSKLAKSSKLAAIAAVMTACGILSIVVFLNSYEVVAVQNIPYINSLKPLQGTQLQSMLKAYTIAEPDEDRLTGVAGTPFALKIPQQNVSLRLARAIEQNDAWLIQASRAHYLTARSDGDSNIEHVIVYISRDWRTVTEPAAIADGDNIFIDTTDGWRYMYRITQIDAQQLHAPYLAPSSDTPLLLVIIEDAKRNKTHLVQADFISVQNI